MTIPGVGRGRMNSIGKGLLSTPFGIIGQGSCGRASTYFLYNKKGHIKSNCWYNPINKGR